MLKAHTAKTVSLAAALAALGTAGAFATASSDSPDDQPTRPSGADTAQTGAPEEGAQATDPDVRRFAGVFRRAQQRSDRARFHGAATAAMAREHGARFEDSRRVAGNLPDVDVWLVPAEDAICILLQPEGAAVEGPGGTCQTLAALAEGRGALTVLQGDATTIVGAVEDGVAIAELELADGSKRTLNVADNVYAARTSAGTRSVRVAGQARPASDGGE
jgi:hypothetical protein